MSYEFKDRRLKYVDLPHVLYQRASQVDILSKQHLRACEKLAEFLSNQKPKTPKAFEQNEWMKDFVLKTANLNSEMIDLLAYVKKEIQEVSEDAKALAEGAKIWDTIRDQQEAIIAIQEVRDSAIKTIYELRKGECRTNTPADK